MSHLNLSSVDFSSSVLRILCHPRYEEAKAFLEKSLSDFDFNDHFVLFSSGTTGNLKGVILSRSSLLNNAQAVNDFYELTAKDTWGLSLPLYHVGGLAVVARAYLSGSSIIDLRGWNPLTWPNKIKNVHVTTIVPTQLFDLVQNNVEAPKNLRFLIVGGDFLSEELKMRAAKLGWPVRHTYGMSEVGSQLASEKDFHPQHQLEVLPLHQVKVKNDLLMVKSPSFFSYQFTLQKHLRKNKESFELQLTSLKDLVDEEGYFLTNDLVKLELPYLYPLGRKENEFKVAGHLINFNQLNQTLSTYLLHQQLYGKAELQVRQDERRGKKLVLLVLKKSLTEAHLLRVKELLAPVQLQEIIEVDAFERTDLGKLKL